VGVVKNSVNAVELEIEIAIKKQKEARMKSLCHGCQKKNTEVFIFDNKFYKIGLCFKCGLNMTIRKTLRAVGYIAIPHYVKIWREMWEPKPVNEVAQARPVKKKTTKKVRKGKSHAN